MPKETDKARLALLRRIIADPASNVCQFTGKALTGGERTDWGLERLPPSSIGEKTTALKLALIDYLDRGKLPTREDAPGDAGMKLDPATFYHFWPVLEGVRLFVKIELKDEWTAEPWCLVLSVKPADSQ